MHRLTPLVDSARPAVRLPSRTALALLSAVAGLAAVSALEPLLSRPYFFPGYAAIIVPAILAGSRYGIVTGFVFSVGYWFYYLAPRGALAVRNPYELTAVAVNFLTGAFVAIMGGALRRAYRQVRGQHELLDRIYHQREDLLRALAHDVRSPLSVIVLNAQLLPRDAGDEAATTRRALVIQKSAATIDSMLRDLAESAQLESGQVKLDAAAVDLATTLRSLREDLAGTLPVERIHLALPGDLPTLHADPKRLERVLVNLVSNALKYSPGPVTVHARRQASDIVVSVQDEGPGIAAEDLPRIFDKYYRAGGARSQHGLGLGLYISRLLVEAHGGRIWAESVPGRGSTFNVAIPTSLVGPAPAPPALQPGSAT